jgi:hypothetical protein
MTSLWLGLGGWIMVVLGMCLDATVGAALAAFTFGLGALCLAPLDFVPPFLWLAAILNGHRALHEIKATGQAGRGAAITGLVAGYLGLGTLVLGILAVVLLVLTGIGMVWWTRLAPYLPQTRL